MKMIRKYVNHLKRPCHTFVRVMAYNLLIKADKEGLELASAAISQGQLIAFPTETVYGLGANALDANAVLSIFEAKGRPLSDPLIVHVADIASAMNLVSIDTKTEQVFRILAGEFWPGPLTVILKAAQCIPRAVTANSGFVGIRIPSHPLALEFLKTCNLPVAAPSANRFGHVSPTRAQHVIDDLGEKGVRVLDGDSNEHLSGHTCLHGIESTVLKIDAEGSRVVILRQGAVSQHQIEQQLSRCIDTVSNWTVESIHRAVPMPHPSSPEGSGPSEERGCSEGGEVAPGQLVTHYAPYIPCYVLASATSSETGSISDVCVYPASMQLPGGGGMERYTRKSMAISRRDLLSGAVVIDFGGQLSWLADKCLAYRDMSASGSTVGAAKVIFSVLRWAEIQQGASIVLIAPVIATSSAPDEDRCRDNMSDMNVESRNRIFDPSLGLADRIFRSASGVAVDIVIE